MMAALQTAGDKPSNCRVISLHIGSAPPDFRTEG